MVTVSYLLSIKWEITAVLVPAFDQGPMKSFRTPLTLFRICLCLSAVLSLSLLMSGGDKLAAQALSQAPNIVFLFSDDQSAADVGCYGNAAVHTPNLDKLAKEGIRFTRAYVASPQCSPSRRHFDWLFAARHRGCQATRQCLSRIYLRGAIA